MAVPTIDPASPKASYAHDEGAVKKTGSAKLVLSVVEESIDSNNQQQKKKNNIMNSPYP
jgi:hypothetical protein